jgi:hypothetical protein
MYIQYTQYILGLLYPMYIVLIIIGGVQIDLFIGFYASHLKKQNEVLKVRKICMHIYMYIYGGCFQSKYRFEIK